jgi:hypothetical protein
LFEILKSTNQPEDAKKNICLADSTGNRVEERMCDNEEHKDGKSYPEMESPTLAESIQAKCADCMGNYADGQVSCETPKCSLFPFMPYNQANKQELI